MAKTARHEQTEAIMAIVADAIRAYRNPDNREFWTRLKQDPIHQMEQEINIAVGRIDPDWTPFTAAYWYMRCSGTLDTVESGS